VRYLCIDLGDKRTGLAVGDDRARLVMPVGVIEAPISADGGAELLAAIVRAVEEHLGKVRGAGAPLNTGELVIGLPLNMDGTEGPRAAGVRTFGARVAAATGRPVRFYDERLSTAAADWSMARSGLTRDQKKSKRDALAAAAILTEFLKRDHLLGDQTNDPDCDVYGGGGEP